MEDAEKKYKPITVRETIPLMNPDNWYKDERGAIHPICIHPYAIFEDKPLHYYMLRHVRGNWFEDAMFNQMPDVYIPDECMDKSCFYIDYKGQKVLITTTQVSMCLRYALSKIKGNKYFDWTPPFD
jgi:hypothetical protein